MPLSWNEIKDRALAFSREWADASPENTEAKSFWGGFFAGGPGRAISYAKPASMAWPGGERGSNRPVRPSPA